MPALPAVPQTLKVTIPYTLAADPSAMNRFYIGYSGTPPTPAQLQTFADVVSTRWGTNLASLANTHVVQQAILAEDLNSATGAVAVGTTTHNGGNGGAPIASGSAAIVEFKIARRYRGGKPKIFLPLGCSTDVTPTGTWGPTFTTNLGNGWAAFMAGILAAPWTGGGTLTHVNVSYYQGFTVVTNPTTHRAKNVPTLRGGGPIVDPVIAYAVEVGIGSQRRRNVI